MGPSARRLRRLAGHLGDAPPAPAAATGWAEVSAAPPPKYVRPPRLEPGSAALAQHLEEEGYAVAKQVVPASKCAEALSLTWDFLEALGSGIDRSDITTWDAPRWPSPPNSGFLAAHGANHCAAAWAIRGAPGVKACFAALWGTDELLVNFDAVLAYRPWWHPQGRSVRAPHPRCQC